MSMQTWADDCLFHQLYRANQKANGYFLAAAAKLSLTPRQLIILQLVDELKKPNQAMITDVSGIDRSTMTEVVRRLVRLGLIRRVRSKTDSRAYELSLTPAGRETLTAGRRIALVVEARLQEELGNKAASQLHSILASFAPHTEWRGGKS